MSSPLKLRAASRPFASLVRLSSRVESAWVPSFLFSSITLDARRSVEAQQSLSIGLQPISLSVPFRRSIVDGRFQIPALSSWREPSSLWIRMEAVFVIQFHHIGGLEICAAQLARPQGTTPSTGWQKLRKDLCQHPTHPRKLGLR